MLSATSPEAIQGPELVDATYRLFLGRQPDEAGSEYWATQATNGHTADVLLSLGKAAEAAGDWAQDLVPAMQRVKAAYHVILDREADTLGMAYWIDDVLDHQDESRWQKFVTEFTLSANEEIHNKQLVEEYLDIDLFA